MKDRPRRFSARATSATKRRPMYFSPAIVSPWGMTLLAVSPIRHSRESSRSRPGTPQLVRSLRRPVLDGQVVVLDQPAQQRQREDGLVEAGAGDHAGDVEPAGVLAVAAGDVHAQAGGPALDGVDLAQQLLEAPLAAALLDLLQPAAPARRGALEDVAQELHARLEGQAREGVDAQRLEQAARHVEVLLVGRGVAAQRDALGADVERVGPLVDRRDAGAEDDVAPVGVVALGLVGLHDARRRSRGRRPSPWPASAGNEQRPVAEREHHVLGAPDEVRVLVVEDEVRRDPPRAAASRRASARASRPSSGAAGRRPPR